MLWTPERNSRISAMVRANMGVPDITGTEWRLWRYVEKDSDVAKCWPWTGAKCKAGYGRFKVDGKLYLPHRIVYALHHGLFKRGRGYHRSVIRHTCDNPSCCNPAHLVLGTQRDNVADMVDRGRSTKGQPRPRP